jgi:hypothetical protein
MLDHFDSHFNKMHKQMKKYMNSMFSEMNNFDS